MIVEVKGRVHSVSDVITNKDGNYPKRNLVVFQENGQYPYYINIEVAERSFDAFSEVKKDDEVNVTVNFGGRLWTNPEGVEMCFNSVRAWKVDILSSQTTQAPEEETDDIPF